MSAPVERAVLFVVRESMPTARPRPDGREAIEVQFNPATLTYNVTVQNNTSGQDHGAASPQPAQRASSTSAKLEFDLLFDTTHSGEDVRQQTGVIRSFLRPLQGDPNTLPRVGFWWGSLRFAGLLDGFRETLDYFSVDGVPLRSGVHVGLTAQDDVFNPEAVQSSAGPTNPDVRLVDAQRLGTLPGGRALAAANGLDSLRNPGAALAAVGAGAQLQGAVGTSAGLSAGALVGASFGTSAGASIGVSAGASVGLSAGGAVGATGVAAGADFSRLSRGRAGPLAAPASASAAALQARAAAPALSGEFGLGGEALGRASPGLATDVGRAARIRFDTP